MDMKRSLINAGFAVALLAAFGCSSKDATVESASASNLNSAVLEEAEGLVYNQQYPQAIKLLNNYIDSNGNSAYALTLRSICYSKVNKPYFAMTDAIEATRINYSPETLVNVGNIERMFGHCERASDAYRQALVLAPGDYQIYANLASAYLCYGALDLAKGALDNANQLNPNDNIVLTNQAIYYVMSKDLDAARTSIDKAIALNPGYAPAYKVLENICGEKGDNSCVSDAKTQYNLARRPKK